MYASPPLFVATVVAFVVLFRLAFMARRTVRFCV
jgi:hypothetical protein